MTESSLSADLEVRIPEQRATAQLSPLQLRYERGRLEALLSETDLRAVIGFGAGAPANAGDARYLHIPLEPVDGAAPFEVWRCGGSARRGNSGHLRWAGNGDYSFVMLEVDEGQCGGLVEAARQAYSDLGGWLADSATPHVLRIWNYLDAINEGEGDAERYREFCRGRAEGMRAAFSQGFPAATAIGVRDGRRVLRVYFIAARVHGGTLENPRQLSAWRYPRQYGPSAPTFARAMHAPTISPQLYISGTAAIVGHASHHPGDFTAQVDETLANFASLLAAAGLPPALHFGAGSTLKVYVRRRADAGRAAILMAERLPAGTSFLLLHGDICRRELLIEIDGVQTG